MLLIVLCVLYTFSKKFENEIAHNVSHSDKRTNIVF